jgi:hypothetical protein
MALPTISVVNFTTGLQDADVQDAARAVNRQVREDFASVWGAVWELRVHATAFDASDPDSLAEETVQGEGVLYLVDESHLPGALGYHALNTRETPFGFVFLIDPAEWTVTLSHEALELIIDPTANILVPGPDPRPGQQSNVVLHTYEVCDAVERTSYEIDGIRVSNFLTPQWFAEGNAPGTRNDFLGVGVASFGATPGSHLAFLDLQAGWQQILGQRTPAAPRFQARQRVFEHDRLRPEEGPLLKILEEMKTRPPKALRGEPLGGLTSVHAFTRTGRKQQLAEQLCQKGAR